MKNIFINGRQVKSKSRVSYKDIVELACGNSKNNYTITYRKGNIMGILVDDNKIIKIKNGMIFSCCIIE